MYYNHLFIHRKYYVWPPFKVPRQAVAKASPLQQATAASSGSTDEKQRLPTREELTQNKHRVGIPVSRQQREAHQKLLCCGVGLL